MSDPRDVTNTADPVGAPRGVGDREYLLCIDNDRSFTVQLPPTGELVVGRGIDDGLSVDDPLVSRTHAQLLIVPDGLRVSDLGSRHGTTVNGERLTEPRLVVSGDVIGIGGTLLVVRRAANRAYGRIVAEPPMLVRRLHEELARLMQYERELSVLVFRSVDHDVAASLLAAIGSRMRAIDTAAPLGPRHVGVLAPELDFDEACALARDVANGPVAAGVATAPFDGIDGDALLVAARAAAGTAGPGEVLAARGIAEMIAIGARKVIVADPAMARLYELARRLGRSNIPVLVHGETGVGKELAAAAVHAFSGRASAPMVSMNCAAITETLAESELFGHSKGAFTGALTAKPGLLEAASGGTVFLDEVGELSPAIQAKLLRVLESGEYLRVGETKPRTTDIRIVAATNRDLEREVEAGRFRGDLYFRLGAARLAIPPLRDRPRDLALLATALLAEACRKLGRAPLELSSAVALALFRHDWPGNIRELAHVIDYAAAAAPDSASELEIWHLPTELAAAARKTRDGTAASTPASAPVSASVASGELRPIADEVRELERARMVSALRASNGLQNRAAELIEMPLRTFVTKLKRYAIMPGDWGGT